MQRYIKKVSPRFDIKDFIFTSVLASNTAMITISNALLFLTIPIFSEDASQNLRAFPALQDFQNEGLTKDIWQLISKKNRTVRTK